VSRHQDTHSLDNATAYIIRRTARLLRFHMDKFLQGMDAPISSEQWFILFRLWEQSGVPQNALTDPLLNDEPNIARHIHTLEEAGYVVRAVDENDKRRRLVSLSDKGRAFVQGMFPHVVEEREAVFDGISAEDIERLVDILHRIDANLSE
jgi:DNA-binding MarR family transcriptional regulator